MRISRRSSSSRDAYLPVKRVAAKCGFIHTIQNTVAHGKHAYNPCAENAPLPQQKNFAAVFYLTICHGRKSRQSWSRGKSNSRARNSGFAAYCCARDQTGLRKLGFMVFSPTNCRTFPAPPPPADFCWGQATDVRRLPRRDVKKDPDLINASQVGAHHDL